MKGAPDAGDAALTPTSDSGTGAAADEHELAPCAEGAVCIVPASSAAEACQLGEGARLRAAGVEFASLACAPRETAANPGALQLQAALLELDDGEPDTPLVLAFGAQAFSYVARLLSIDDSVGSEGSYQLERFQVLELAPGGGPGVILQLTQRTESWSDAPPGPARKQLSRWLFLCESAPTPTCVRMLLGASERAKPRSALAHDKFDLQLTIEGSKLRLERSSGQLPKAYRALLGEHDAAFLIDALKQR